MNNPIKRDFDFIKLRNTAKANSLELSLALPALPESQPTSGATAIPDCEVTELNGEAAWDEWQDSTFLQDFEESCFSGATLDITE